MTSKKMVTEMVRKCIFGGMFAKQMVLMGVTACLACPMVQGDEAQTTEPVAKSTTDTMWEIMLRDNVITQEQYDHVQKTGALRMFVCTS